MLTDDLMHEIVVAARGGSLSEAESKVRELFMTSSPVWRNGPEAIAARNDLKARIRSISTRIFKLKRDREDGKVATDVFEDLRMELNDEILRLEDEIDYVDAWLEERSRERAARNQASELSRFEAAQAAKVARAQAIVESERVRTERTLSNDRQEAAWNRCALNALLKAVLDDRIAAERLTLVLSELERVMPGRLAAVLEGRAKCALYARESKHDER